MASQTRRQFITNAALTSVGLTFSTTFPTSANTSLTSKSKAKYPNVILIITDDQGYGDLACHGNKNIKTPNIDSLHAQSTRLTNFHVGPTCAPTRAALMTGRYCNRTGVWHTVMGRSLLRKDETTLANVFADTGYKTAFFGKWHLGDNYPFRPQDRGFGEVLAHGGGGITQAPDHWNNDYFDDTYFHNGNPKKCTGYCTDIWFEGAMEFIEQNKNKPFFCYLATNAPHGPFNVPQKYIDMYKDNPDVPNANFYGMITNIDDNLGLLEKKLKQLDLTENTIMIFMTDNGTAAGFKNSKGFNANMRGTKGSEYDGGHRVPFFIRYPNSSIKPANDINNITAHVDVMPTLIDMCKLTPKTKNEFDGTSLTPLLFDQNQTWPSRTLVTDSQRVENPIKWRKSAVMTDRYRLVNGTELYDMTTDPSQKNNIAKTNTILVKKLRARYDKWWASVSDKFDEFCPIIVGHPAENPTRLSSHDMHNSENYQNLPAWNQAQVRAAPSHYGFWAIDVAKTGTYKFELMRWPKEANAPINATIPQTETVPGNFNFKKGKQLNIKSATIKIAHITKTSPVTDKDYAATFTLKLKAGQTKLITEFTDDQDKTRGAYYVYVTRL